MDNYVFAYNVKDIFLYRKLIFLQVEYNRNELSDRVNQKCQTFLSNSTKFQLLARICVELPSTSEFSLRER